MANNKKSSSKSTSKKKGSTTANTSHVNPTPVPRERAVRGEEGRVSQRIPIQLLVDYRANGHYLFDFCRDLGAGGVFIETSNPLKQGSVVELIFTIPDSKETLEAKGKVIWVQSKVPGKDLTPGMGVQFENFDSRQRKMLEEFVSRYHGANSKSGNSRSAS